MNKQKLIEKIEARHVCDLAVSDSFKNGFNTMKGIAVDLASELEEPNKPQAEKVEVPSCMGTFLDRYPDKKETAMHIIMHDFCESKYFAEFAEFHLADYPMGWDRLMASALMFGYTVKKEPTWVVKNANGKYFVSLSYGSVLGTLRQGQIASKRRAYEFPDKAKAEAVAVLVDGSVEEI